MIQVKPTQFDFGDLPINKQKKFSVEVTNIGNTLAIIDASPKCSSCTTAKVVSHHLKPNQSTLINMVFTPTKVGDNHKVVGILENSNEVVKVTFQANVING